MNGLRFADKLMTLRRERKITQEQLADFLAIDRSAMSNELSKMRKEGILEFERNSFLLKDYSV